MADALVSGILEQLATMTVEKAKQEFGLFTGVGEQVKKLTRNLKAVQAVLADAEEKQMMPEQESLKNWVNSLKEASYDIEDVLDKWNALASTSGNGNGVESTSSAATTKVCSFITCFLYGGKVVWRRRSIAMTIKEINKRLDEIAEEKNRYVLVPREILTRSRRPERETTSTVDVSKVHGREEVKRSIVSNLLSGTSSDEADSLRIISIIGMGGIGKTTLAQLVYHDHEVQEHFDHRIWVCVSDFFDKIAVVRAILVELEGLDHNRDSVPLESLLKRMCNCMEGKKFFLVLDDVWTEDGRSWEELIQTFKCGASGSRILVTTRKETVAKTMESSHIVPLEKLSQDECWYVLRQMAFSGRKEEEWKSLEDVGQKIAAKCKGLPLAAKTLGSLLRFKRMRVEWENVLNSEIWKLEEVHEGVLAPLLLSYYDLPSAIRRCFLYCVIFPKDHVYSREHLIQLWMAQGYLGLDGDPDLELTGEEYFEFLADRSFFQEFHKDQNGVIDACKIHDIVHDFAQSLAMNEIATERASHGEISRCLYRENSTRHLGVLVPDGFYVPTLLSGAENLRSFINFPLAYISVNQELIQDLRRLCEGPKCLRVLELIVNDYSEVSSVRFRIPKEIRNLVHLRYLKLSVRYIPTSLPESLCDLRYLQTLDLRSFIALPHGMGRLINLRSIDTTSCIRPFSYPKGVRGLTSLKKLRGITMWVDRNDREEFCLGDLKVLNNLTSLWMEPAGDSIDDGEVKKAELHNKRHLQDFRMRLSFTNMREDDVFAALNRPSNLRFCDTWDGLSE